MAKVVQDSSTTGSKPCPVCIRSGHPTSTLILRQVNATEAIYVCDHPECCYPVGEEMMAVRRIVPELVERAEEREPIATVQVSAVLSVQEESTSQDSALTSNLHTASPDQALPETWYDSLVDPDVCSWLDSQTN